MPPLDRIKVLLGSAADQDALLLELLDEARDWMLNYIGKPELPDGLTATQIRLAAMLYNRRGVEGMSAASEGGVSRTIESVPEDLRRALNMHRSARSITMTKPRA